MAADWLLDIDPDASHWTDEGRGIYTNTVTGKRYTPGDMVNHMLAKINAQNKAEGKGAYVPSYTGLPDGLKPDTWGQGSEPPDAGPDDTGGETGGGSTGGGSTGGGQIGSGNTAQDWSDFFLGGITPGFTWNPSGGGGGPMPGQMAGAADGPSWTPGGMSGGGMQRTGQREAFRPFGSIEDYSSEILRYGGPVSGSGGRWDNVTPGEMVGVGGTTKSPTKVDVPGFEGYTQQVLPGGGYQNIKIDKRDGETWTDPATGQTYVFRDGRFQKADLKDRIGPTTEGPKVTTTGGTGTDDDPLQLILSGNPDPQTVLAQLLRHPAT